MKIIFLDFDGVINSSQYFSLLKENRDFTYIKEDEVFDRKAINLINELVNKTGAKVIISSSWRINYSLLQLNDLLKAHGATFEAIDVTPNLFTSDRGSEIQSYLDDSSFRAASFVIIDDMWDMGTFTNSDNFIRTSFSYGFTEDHLQECIKVLNENK